MDDLLAEFLTEAAESIVELDDALLKLERNPDDQSALSLVFRLVHTIKGTCGFLGLPRLERVAHAAENVLGQVRDGQLAASTAIIGPVLAAIDAIKLILNTLATTGTEPAGNDGVIIAALDRLLGSDSGSQALPVDIEDVWVGPGGEAVETVISDVAHGPDTTPDTSCVPDLAEVPASPVVPAAAAVAPEAGWTVQTIRVGVDVLDNLMTLVSELVLARNQLLQLAGDEENASTAPLQRLSHITSTLQEGVMKTRMQPIGNAWNKLPRQVRDLAHDLGKRIELVLLGQDTELDRQVLELIRDPLTHMVRNSCDHGLESTERRRVAGKPETGRITLNAFHEAGHIVIELSDDGAGLDIARLRTKAASQGLATEAELAVMEDAQLHRFIFHAGFSTAVTVTAVSGRGVGMDVVRTNVERIGGVIDLRSTPGQGTTFTIRIPLTLAIVSALIVQAAGERFAIPQLSVVELVSVGEGSERTIEHIGGAPVLRLRDRLLPLVSLATMLRLEGASNSSPIVVVASVGAATLGIVVDRVFDSEEIVVKPVSAVLRHLGVYGGNTILGDGSVVMILDPNGIAKTTGILGGHEARSVPPLHSDAQNSSDTTALLLFRAGPGAPKAVPLELVARLEDIPRDRIETAGGLSVTQYRGKLMPLMAMDGVQAGDPAQGSRPTQAILVFSDQGRTMGLMVDEIIDVVQEKLAIEIGCGREGLLGTAVIAGHATDVIDISHWLTCACREWFGVQPGKGAEPRVLVVEDSKFFRNLLVPTLAAAGYDVTHVDSGAKALQLRETGRRFDAIISDIEMPDMDGFAFAARAREPGPWSAVPLIALSGSCTPERARKGGFDDHVRKGHGDALLTTLRRHIAVHEPA